MGAADVKEMSSSRAREARRMAVARKDAEMQVRKICLGAPTLYKHLTWPVLGLAFLGHARSRAF